MVISMDDRGKAFESKWAHDAESRFKVEARRNRLLGSWAAAKKGLSGEAAEQFILGVIAADFEEAGDEDAPPLLLRRGKDGVWSARPGSCGSIWPRSGPPAGGPVIHWAFSRWRWRTSSATWPR